MNFDMVRASWAAGNRLLLLTTIPFLIAIYAYPKITGRDEDRVGCTKHVP